MKWMIFGLVALLVTILFIFLLVQAHQRDRRRKEEQIFADLRRKNQEDLAGKHAKLRRQLMPKAKFLPPMTVREREKQCAKAAEASATGRQPHDDNDVGSSLALGLATGVPIGPNLAGAVAGAAIHHALSDDGSRPDAGSSHSSSYDSGGSSSSSGDSGGGGGCD